MPKVPLLYQSYTWPESYFLMSFTVLSIFRPVFSAGPLPISLSWPVTSSTFSPAFCMGPLSHPAVPMPTTRMVATVAATRIGSSRPLPSRDA